MSNEIPEIRQSDLLKKEEKLYELMKEYAKENVCIAFSGGTDSSLLLRLLVDCASPEAEVYAVTFNTVLHPSCDLEMAEKVAGEMGAVHKVIHMNELENPEIKYNPTDRCYLCKKALFTRLLEYAEEVGAVTVIEGTNEDDLHVYRPGLKAVRETGVKSPLAEAGLTKEEVRILAAKLGISVANRPASPCLATRLPYGARLDTVVLKQIEDGEEYLKANGFEVVRLRLHGQLARIEIPKSEFSRFLNQADEITRHLKNLGFPYVTLDLEGFRSGSMDETLPDRIF